MFVQRRSLRVLRNDNFHGGMPRGGKTAEEERSEIGKWRNTVALVKTGRVRRWATIIETFVRKIVSFPRREIRQSVHRMINRNFNRCRNK